MLPTPDDIVRLHHKYAPSDKAFDIVFTHCTIVWEICQQLFTAKPVSIDHNLVQAGALLHDIGAYRFIDVAGKFSTDRPYLQHGIAGYELLFAEKIDEAICRIAKAHTGVGIGRDEVLTANLSLPPDDYTAHTLEEQLVMYADKFHSKTPTFHSFDTYRKKLEKFPNALHKQTTFDEFANTFGKPDLSPLIEKYHMPIDWWRNFHYYY